MVDIHDIKELVYIQKLRDEIDSKIRYASKHGLTYTSVSDTRLFGPSNSSYPKIMDEYKSNGYKITSEVVDWPYDRYSGSMAYHPDKYTRYIISWED